MKHKYLTVALLATTFALQGLAQTNTYILHKKDGTKMELPIDARNISFSGKPVVNDGDYIQIRDLQAFTRLSEEKAIVSLYLSTLTDSYQITRLESWGVCYATTPEVTVENETIVANNEPRIELSGLEFNTTYYLKAFVQYQGKYYYSKEESVTTPKPTMESYGYTAIPEALKEAGIYVAPTTEAWENFYSAQGEAFMTEKLTDLRTALLTEKWNQYLTVEKAQTLSAQCSEKVECEEGTIYLLGEIGEEFMQMFNQTECVMKGRLGLLTDERYTKYAAGPDTVFCPTELDVPENTYYKFTPTVTSNPCVTYQIEEPLLAGYEYEVEVVMAPDAETAEADRLPTKIQIVYLNGEIGGAITSIRLVNSQEVPGNACTTLTYTINPLQFAQNMIQIQTRISNRELTDGTYSRDLRIAHIKVKPLGKKEKTE